MNTNSLNLQTLTLQKKVVSLLGQISLLMDEASRLTGDHETVLKYERCHQEIIKAARNVEELRLKMAIAAPMKTGKSTIINAIIGQPLLPSRNAAMTTLPTEILLNAQLSEPVLILSPKTLSILEITQEKLQQKIKMLAEKTLEEKISSYPHLATLVKRISTPSQWHLAEKVFGCKAINQTLTDLNDLIRLCTLILPEIDPLPTLTEFPHIETPFWGSKQQGIGNLLIVDTPGPNEAGEHQLTEVVNQQLENSLIVLMVLDFTQLKTEAAEQVKQDVKKVIEVRGNENLYILINKVDQRRSGDLTPEQLRKFVSAEFGLSEENHDQQLFEISARQGFVAAHFIQETEQVSEIAIANLETAIPFAKEVFGIDWEEELEETTREELKTLSQKLWKKSGFPKFLDTAISHLIENAVSLCIKSALKLSKNSLTEVLKDSRFKNSNIIKTAKDLSDQITQIYEVLSVLKIWHNCLQEIDQIVPAINQAIDQDVSGIKSKVKSLFKTYFHDQEYEHSSRMTKLYTRLFPNSKNFSNPLKFGICDSIHNQFQFKPIGKIQFKTVEEAQGFSKLSKRYIKPEIKKILENQETKAIQYFIENRNSIIDFLDENTQLLSARSRNWFNDNMIKILVFPKIHLQTAQTFKLIRPGSIKKVKIKGKKPDLWYNKIWDNINQSSPIKYEVYFQSIDQINTLSIDASIEQMKQKTSEYIEQGFKAQINGLFKSFVDHLLNSRVELDEL